MTKRTTKALRLALAGLLFPALLPAAELTLSVDITDHARDWIGADTIQEPEYRNGSTPRVGGAGSAAGRFVDNAILGFDLPTFDSFSEIQDAEFSITLTGKTQQAGYKTDLYLFNAGVTPSALPAADVVWNNDALDDRGNVGLVMSAFAEEDTPNDTRPTVTLTSAQLEDFYQPDGTPTQTTIWFRMNLDNSTVGTNRYEYDLTSAELVVTTDSTTTDPDPSDPEPSIAVNITDHVRDWIGADTIQEPEYRNGSTPRVGGAGSAAGRFVDNAILGFNLPTLDSADLEAIESIEFSVTLTGKTQQAGYKTDLYLFNAGVTPSALPATDVIWNNDTLDDRGNVGLVMPAFAEEDTPNDTRPTALVTAAQIEDFYNQDGTPTQETIWFRMNLDNSTVGTNRYEYDLTSAELMAITASDPDPTDPDPTDPDLTDPDPTDPDPTDLETSISVTISDHARDWIGAETIQEPEYRTGTTNRVGGAGSAAGRFLDNAILGFDLPTFGSFSEIQNAEFSVTLTGKTQQAGYKTDLYLFNAGVTPSELTAADVISNDDGVDDRGDVGLIMHAFAEEDTANDTRPTALVPAAVLEDFYLPDGTPTQDTIWFRMNLDNATSGVNRYEYDIASAELIVTTSAPDPTDPDPSDPADSYAGYPILEGTYVDTGAWLGMLYIVDAPWVWSYRLETWFYMPEPDAEAPGAWVHVISY